SIGEDPHSIENAALERSRSGLSPAATSSAPAESEPTPNRATSLGAAAPVSRASSASRGVGPAERRGGGGGGGPPGQPVPLGVRGGELGREELVAAGQGPQPQGGRGQRGGDRPRLQGGG